MAQISIFINGESKTAYIDPRTPLLWALRDTFALTGTKYGCGIGQCGACTVILEGNAVRSCQTPVSRAAGKQVTTIEGLSKNRSHPVQRAWIEEQVPQCGYCQSGQIMSAIALLESNPKPSRDDVNSAMSGNLCRCGTYPRIRAAIADASNSLGKQ